MQEKTKLALAVPKDTGWAWMCLLGTAIVQCLVIGGCVDSFGVLYTAIQKKFDATATQVAWIPATLAFCYLISATPANLLCSRIGTRGVVLIGGILMNAGFALSAFAQNIWMMYITYGLLAGVGAGLSYAPSIVIIGTYFEKRRALAYGMIFASASIGSFVCPPVIKYVLDLYGLESTCLIMGGVMFHAAIAGMLFRPPQFYLARYLMKERLRLKTTTFQSRESTTTFMVSQNESVRENSFHSCGKCSITRKLSNSSGLAEVIRINTCYDNGSAPAPFSRVEQTCGSLATVEARPDWKSPVAEGTTGPLGSTKMNNGSTVTTDGTQECIVSDDITVTFDNRLATKPSSQWSILKHPLLYIYAVSYSMVDSTYHNTFTMIPPHASDIGIMDVRAVFLLSITGISGSVSRLLTGWFADLDLVGKKHVYLLAITVCAIVLCVFPLVNQFAHMAVLCAFCGVTAGSINVLAPVLLADEFGVIYIPVTYGVMYSTSAFFYLASPVLMGFLRDQTGRWNESFLVSGSLVMFAAIVNLAEPWALKHGRKQMEQK